MGANDGQISHTDHLGPRFLDDGDSCQKITVIGKLLFHILQEEQIDVVDDLKVPGQ